MGCLLGMPLIVEGSESDSGRRLVCVEVGVSISVEGCVDASTSPSMTSSSYSSRFCCCSGSSSNHAGASSMIGISTPMALTAWSQTKNPRSALGALDLS
jgi:hypothetical protein